MIRENIGTSNDCKRMFPAGKIIYSWGMLPARHGADDTGEYVLKKLPGLHNNSWPVGLESQTFMQQPTQRLKALHVDWMAAKYINILP